MRHAASCNPHIVGVNRTRPSCTSSYRNTSSHAWSVHATAQTTGSATQPSSSASSKPFSNAAYCDTDSFAFAAPIVRASAWLPSRANGAASALRAQRDAWPIPPRTSFPTFLPEVHYRQWVLSFPKRVRFALACDHELLSKVLRACLNKLFSWQKRAARKQGIPAPECGAVTFCQRFGSLLNLNCHFHSLLPDGVFTDTGDGVAFLSIPPPSPDDIRRLTEQIAKATETILARHHQAGHSDDQPTDILDQERDQATHTNRFATKAAAPTKPHKRAHFYFGYSLHAERYVESDDREALERLCRYGARAPIANSRLSINVDGDAVLELKRPLADGRTRLTFAPIELLRKLATLIPPPKKNLTRYHGVFAPAHHLRKLIVAPKSGTTSQQSSQKTTRRLPWAALLRRVFAIDILKCDHCAGTMTLIAIIPASQIAHQILDHLGLEMRANATKPRGPP